MSTTLEISVQQLPIELPSLTVDPSEHETGDDFLSLQREPSVSAPPIDVVPDGGYGWVVVSACSLITYALVPHIKLYSMVVLLSQGVFCRRILFMGCFASRACKRKFCPRLYARVCWFPGSVLGRNWRCA